MGASQLAKEENSKKNVTQMVNKANKEASNLRQKRRMGIVDFLLFVCQIEAMKSKKLAISKKIAGNKPKRNHEPNTFWKSMLNVWLEARRIETRLP